MSYVAHQYSRVDFYSFLEVNLSLYYGGVMISFRFVLHNIFNRIPLLYKGTVVDSIWMKMQTQVHWR